MKNENMAQSTGNGMGGAMNFDKDQARKTVEDHFKNKVLVVDDVDV